MRNGMFLSNSKHLLFDLRSILVILPIPDVSVFITACQKQNKVLSPPGKITIAYSTAANSILVCIAFAMGHLAEEGLDAASQPHAFWKLADNKVFEGLAVLATVSPIALATTNGQRLVASAVILPQHGNETIASKQESGIASPIASAAKMHILADKNKEIT